MYRKLSSLFFSKKPALAIAVVRYVVYGALVYKLLSRDFTVFTFAPDSLMQFYPSSQYNISTGYSALGFPFVVDLATGHWLHWFLPMPGIGVMSGIQWVAIALCAMVILFGRGPKNIFAVGAYLSVSYLWGFNWRTGGEIDSIELTLQLALVYCFFRAPEALTPLSRTKPLEYSRAYGAEYSIVLLMFCFNYFISGSNKLMDISPWEWFEFDLVQSIGMFRDMYELGFHIAPAPGLHHLRYWTWLNDIAVPFAYIAELCIPIMFFRRHWIGPYWIFFELFHISLWGIGLIFFGLVLIWGIFLPVHRFFQPVVLTWDDESPFCQGLVRLLRRTIFFNLVQFDCTGRVSVLGPIGFHARGVGSPSNHDGIFALRRIFWAMPFWWPVMLVLYFPGVTMAITQLGRWLPAPFVRPPRSESGASAKP